MRKSDAIMIALEEGKSVKEICDELNTTATYVYKVKSEMKKAEMEANDEEGERQEEPLATSHEPLVSNTEPLPNMNTNYACDYCGAGLKLAQKKCRNCGEWVDWRGELDDSPVWVICSECGAVCGQVKDNPTKCPNCGLEVE